VNVSGTAERPLTIEGAAGEQVIISGADLVQGWQKTDDQRPIWRKTPWDVWKRFKPDPSQRGEGPQLIVDNASYRQVADRQQMFPGSFCYDATGEGALYVWMYPARGAAQQIPSDAQWWDNPVNLASEDPNVHEVQASVRSGNLRVRNQSYVIVRNLVVRYNTAGAQTSALAVDAVPSDKLVSHNTVEDCLVEYCHGLGLGVTGDQIVVRRCYLRYNGGMGAGGQLANSLFEDNVLDGNSNLGHSHQWEAGGVKFVRSIRITVRHCQFINNDGPGLWFDWGHSGHVIERNFCSHNSGSGIMVEVSPHFSSTDAKAKAVVDKKTARMIGMTGTEPAEPIIIRNNICVGNRWDNTLGSGIMLQLASQCIVVNNTCLDNAMYGIFLRYHPYDNAGHRCVNNVLLNNLCADNGGSQIYITPDPRDKPGLTSGNRSDYNLFWDSASWQYRHESTQINEYGWNRSMFSRWGKTQGDGSYSVEEWFKLTGFDEHSIQWEPMFVSVASLDFRLRHDSPAIGAGVTIEQVTDDFLGRKRPSDRPPSIGALEYFPGKPQPGCLPMNSVCQY
jgi:parallel beta-helix repeat protein